jgi:hypothetical protein
MNTKLTKLATMGAAATAIGAVGFFTVPAPAQAAPLAPLPLAPACTSYGFNGATALSQDNGWAVQFNSTGPSATGPATASSDTGTQMHGTLSGGINGRAVDLTINWDNGQKGRYVGQVNEDAGFAAATGTTGDAGWRLLGPLQCLTPAAASPPADNRPSAPIGKALVRATVGADNDVYDVKNVPDGTGHIIGQLHAGDPVQVQGHCTPGDAEGKAGDWNHVVVPDMPGGTGWAWGFITCP